MSEIEDLSSKEELVSKQRLEKKQLQAKILQLKKSVNKDKKKKKEVALEIAQLEQELHSKHEVELEQFESSTKCLEVAVENVSLSDECADANHSNDDVKDDCSVKRVSKAEKRRQKKAQAQKERDELIKESEENSKYSLRSIEVSNMKKILKERNMAVENINPDGDCLFAAIAHQLSNGTTVSELRLTAATFIKDHMDDFLPFFTDPSTGDLLTPQQLEEYCIKIQTTSTWGGQPELRALSQVLKRKIEVIQAEGAPIIFGEEFDGQCICLTYYRHLYELGEHYNSVVKSHVQGKEGKS